MKKLLSFFCILVFATVTCLSQDAPESFAFSIKGGLTLGFPGKINIAGYQLKSEVAPIIKADLDGILVEKFSMGAMFFYSPGKIEGSRETGNFICVGGTIKPRFTLGSGGQIMPALVVGYSNISNPDWTSSSDGLNVGFQLEITFPLSSNNFVGTEFGFFSQPVGGNGFYDITFPPIFYVAIGYTFGK
jgi:hypothetical protein